MSGLNKVMLIGRVGRDAELRHTQGGSPVLTINLATSETWRDKQTGQRKEATEWHRISYWGKGAEAVSAYVLKGKEIYVEGALRTREWTGKDGQKRYTTEINAIKVTLLGGGGRANGNGQRRQAEPMQQAADEFDKPGGFDEPAPAAAGGGMDNSEWPGEEEIPF